MATTLIVRNNLYTRSEYDAASALSKIDPKAQKVASSNDRRYFKKHRRYQYRLRGVLPGEFPTVRWVLAKKISRRCRERRPVPLQVPVEALLRKYGPTVPDRILAKLYADIKLGMLTHINSHGEVEY